MVGKSIIVDREKIYMHLDRLKHIPIIDVDHHRIHEGHRFTVVDFDSSVAVETPKYWHIKAPNLPLIHFIYSVYSARSGTVQIFRNPTLSNDGTPLNIDNNNQNNLRTSTLLAFKDPTVTDDGTLIGGQIIGSDGDAPNNKGADGGDKERVNERILKRNSSYIIKFTAVLNNTRVSIRMEHYEQVG